MPPTCPLIVSSFPLHTDGASSTISYVLPTSLGLAVGVCCRLPPGAASSEDVQYTTAVLQHEPDQIFPAAAFGQTSVVLASHNAVGGDLEEAAKAASLTEAALSVAGVIGHASLAFTVTFPGLAAEEEFLGGAAEVFMSQLEAALPGTYSDFVYGLLPYAFLECTRLKCPTLLCHIIIMCSWQLRPYHRCLCAPHPPSPHRDGCHLDSLPPTSPSLQQTAAGRPSLRTAPPTRHSSRSADRPHQSPSRPRCRDSAARHDGCCVLGEHGDGIRGGH
jgi:hypothetical protein